MANKQLHFFLVSVCILVTHSTKGAFGAVDSPTLNRVVYEGATDTPITCIFSYAHDVSIRLLPFAFTETNSNVLLYNVNGGGINPSFNESFSIEQLQGTLNYTYTLSILNATTFISPSNTATISTAGVYWCTDSWSEFLVQLVVIRSDPICSSNFTQSTAMLQSGDVIQLSCTIVYGATRDPGYLSNFYGDEYLYDYGTIDAVMTWLVNGQPIPAGNANFTIASSETEVTASSTLLINDNFDAIYACETTFSPPSDPNLQVGGPRNSSIATNAPDYFKTCTISPATTPTPSTTTTTTTTTTYAPTTTTTTGLLPCYGILHLLSDLLRASCYDDCSSDTSILGIIFWPNCRKHCRSLNYSGGTCMTSTSDGCPCIHPGNKKCICS